MTYRIWCLGYRQLVAGINIAPPPLFFYLVGFVMIVSHPTWSRPTFFEQILRTNLTRALGYMGVDTDRCPCAHGACNLVGVDDRHHRAVIAPPGTSQE